jgi:hypothetical protein
MDIDSLVARFASLPGARVGAGPRHPTRPDPSLEPKIAGFLAANPALERDEDYVKFLWKYAGLSWASEDQTHAFYVFGFSSVTADIVDGLDGPLIDADGFLAFADAVEHTDTETYAYSFAFNVRPDHEWAVYRLASTTRTLDRPYVRYTDSFRSFLAEAVANDAAYERPPLD